MIPSQIDYNLSAIEKEREREKDAKENGQVTVESHCVYPLEENASRANNHMWECVLWDYGMKSQTKTGFLGLQAQTPARKLFQWMKEWMKTTRWNDGVWHGSPKGIAFIWNTFPGKSFLTVHKMRRDAVYTHEHKPVFMVWVSEPRPANQIIRSPPFPHTHTVIGPGKGESAWPSPWASSLPWSVTINYQGWVHEPDTASLAEC